jgi:hypothetical protein
MGTLLSTDQEMTSANNAIDVYAQHRGECRVAASHRGSILTVPLLSTHYSKCWCFQSLCSSRRACQWQSSRPSYGQQCAPRQPHPPPAGIIFWSARWLETSESGYPVTRRRHYTVRPLRKPQNSRILWFVRLRDQFLFSGDCSRRTKLNCHSAVYLEVVINQSSEHDWELRTVTIFDIYGSCESINWLMLGSISIWEYISCDGKRSYSLNGVSALRGMCDSVLVCEVSIGSHFVNVYWLLCFKLSVTASYRIAVALPYSENVESETRYLDNPKFGCLRGRVVRLAWYKWSLTLILQIWKIGWAANNASK